MSYEYYDNGALKKEIKPNGTYAEYIYNSGLLTRIANRKADGTVIAGFDYEYAYDPATGKWGRDGSVTAIVEDILNPDGTRIQARTDLSVFDLTSTEVRTGSLPYTKNYTYDPVANTLTENKNGVQTVQTFNDAFVLQSAGAASFAYNAFGGVETHTEPGKTIDYSYDPFGRISQIVQNGQVMAQFGYDGNGSVIERTIGSQSYDYTIDPYTGATISEDSGTELTYYDLDPVGEVVASIDPSDVIYYHFGADGNTYALTTAHTNPQVAGSATYSTGGESLASTGRMPNQAYQSGGGYGHHTLHQEPELVFVQIGGGGAHGSGGGRYYVTRRPPPPGYRTIMPYRPTSYVRFPMWFNGDPCGEAPGESPREWYENASDFVAGWGDALTLGATKWPRRYLGEWFAGGDANEVVDYDSGWYKGGYVGGTLNGIALTGPRGPWFRSGYRMRTPGILNGRLPWIGTRLRLGYTGTQDALYFGFHGGIPRTPEAWHWAFRIPDWLRELYRLIGI